MKPVSITNSKIAYIIDGKMWMTGLKITQNILSTKHIYHLVNITLCNIFLSSCMDISVVKLLTNKYETPEFPGGYFVPLWNLS